MKIQAYEYTRLAAETFKKRKNEFKRGAEYVAEYLERVFEFKDEIISVSSRVKTADSLREKILRNELYKRTDLEHFFDNVSDIIGIRIGCRFLRDEKDVYERLRNVFCLSFDNVFFHPLDNQNIFLNFSGAQPERQKNGFEIYRIDGYTELDGKKLRFELQIKSLINEFWSEIEHKIIYKNKRSMLADGFMSDMMNSIYGNLVNIDKQLYMMYTRAVDTASSEFYSQTEALLVIIVNELYTRLVERKTGISVNVNEFAESLVHYILTNSTFLGSGENSERFGGVVMRLISRVRELDMMKDIRLGEEIFLPKNLKYRSPLCRKLGEKFIESMNGDFFLNAYFHILFCLETGNDAEDFMRYVEYFENRILQESALGEAKLCALLDDADASKIIIEDNLMKLLNENKKKAEDKTK